MPDTITWLIAKSYTGTASICLDTSTDAEIEAFCDRYETRLFQHIVRPDGIHWDGEPLDK